MSGHALSPGRLSTGCLVALLLAAPAAAEAPGIVPRDARGRRRAAGRVDILAGLYLWACPVPMRHVALLAPSQRQHVRIVSIPVADPRPSRPPSLFS